MTTIGFVSTSVLESSDGVEYNDEKRVESQEVKAAEERAKQALNKPLWEQLQAQRDKKQEEYDAVGKQMFAPPKALDDEEAEYLQGVQEQRQMAKDKRREWEQQELELFSMAKANQILSTVGSAPDEQHGEGAPKAAGGAAAASAKGKMPSKAKPPPPKFKLKPKGQASTKLKGSTSSRKRKAEGEPEAAAAAKDEGPRAVETTRETREAKQEEPSGLLGLGDYGSDDSSSD